MSEPKKEVKDESMNQTNDQVQVNYVSIAYIDEPASLDDEIVLRVSDIDVDDSTIGLSNLSFLKVESQFKDNSIFASIHKQREIQIEPPILQLKGFAIPELNQITDESFALLSGSTYLNDQVLDLLFDLKPLGNFSRMIYGLEHFAPNNKIENVLLLGLLKRSIILFGTKETPLSKSRYTDVDALYTVANEFVLSLLKYNQCELLLKLLETIVISSNYNSNILLQYALLLDKMGHHKMALEYFILIADVSPAFYLHFIIIHTYYVHLQDFDSGIEWCHKLLKLKQVQSDAGLKSKCYLFLGVGSFWKHLRMKDFHVRKSDLFINQHNTLPIMNNEKDVFLFDHICSEKCYHINACDISISKAMIRVQSAENVSKSYFSKVCSIISDAIQSPLEIALSHLLEAAEYDCHNHVIHYYLALICAQGANMEQAMAYIKHSLQLNAEYLPSLHLLVLLESSHNISSAQSLLDSILSEYPDNVQLFMTQAYISISQRNYTQALENLRGALIVWEKLYGDKEGDTGYLYDDTDSGQFSVDYRDRINVYNHSPCTCASETSNTDSDRDEEDNSKALSESQNTELKSDTKRVTFHLQTPEKKKFPARSTWEVMATNFLHTDKKRGARVENFYNLVSKTFSSGTICHDELPSKRRLLFDIWGMFARIYLALNAEEDFVQCLSELLNICDVTVPYLGSIERGTVEPMSSVVLSKYCTEILLHLGIYFQKRRDVTKAQACYKNVLSISHNHVEALYHRGCIERDLGLLNRALLTTQQCLQLNNVGVFKAKLYFLMGEIFDGLGEADNSLVAYEMALLLNDTIPVCSYDIIPFVWK